MRDLREHIVDVPDFPKPGILFRDISPLLRSQLAATTDALSALATDTEWQSVDALVGVESRGFVLASALALRRDKGLIMLRKQGKLPPPTISERYQLEYGTDALEIRPGAGRVLLIDDVLATGGTLRAAADLCARAGYEVAGLLVLIDLRIAPFEWRSMPARSVIEY
ncbi:MAG TPA: adenine phosphoribosyltransferase [Steroidobacteraceae bacterium]|nr:adenine phosphoribosyltransferase [Steroidobacteraceae bacterium]